MKGKKNNLFFVSLPFDVKNSGDYDYCSTIASTINRCSNNGRWQAYHVTSDKIEGYDSSRVMELLEALSSSKNKGTEFAKALNIYRNSLKEENLILPVVDYLVKEQGENTGINILNLQLRPPESGFLFSPKDLSNLQKKNFKVVVTCHEYKLNFDRKWFQAILHPYFERADLVLFFNEQDRESASLHAERKVFLDDVFLRGVLPAASDDKIDLAKLARSFSSKDHVFLNFLHKTPSGVYVNKLELSQLACDKFVGNIACQKGGEVHFRSTSISTIMKPPFTFSWLETDNLQVKTTGAHKLMVSGLIVYESGNEVSEEISQIKTSLLGRFDFCHDSYILTDKSVLTKVPPTTGVIAFDVPQFIKKSPNIVVFGLIREGKGFEEALDIIETINSRYKKELPDTRLIIVGKPDSFRLLETIISKKYGLEDKLVNKVKPGGANEFHRTFIEALENLEKADQDDKSEEIKTLLGFIIKYGFEEQKLQDSLEFLGRKFPSLKGEQLKIVGNNIHAQLKAVENKSVELTSNFWQLLLKQLSNHFSERLPIDLYLDVNREDLPKVFEQAKYAIKYDEKGWANNASGLINLLSYGTILYTSYGMCTDSFVADNEAMVLSKHRYCLKEGMEVLPNDGPEMMRQHYLSTKHKRQPNPKKILITSHDIIKDIIERENRYNGEEAEEYTSVALNSSANNVITFTAAGELLKEFTPECIVTTLLGEFEKHFFYGET